MATSVDLNTSAKPEAGQSTSGLIPPGTTPLHRLDGDLWVEIVDPRAQPPELAKSWDDLTANASDPNVFFERWFLGPAMASFGAGRDVVLACVHRGSSRKDVAPAMVGLFPLERTSGGIGRASTLKLFWNQYTFLQTPLIRQGHEVETWQTFLKWADECSGCDLVDLPLVRGEGTVGKSLVEVAHRRKPATLISSVHTRALMRRCGSEEEFLSAALTSKQRHQYERQSRRLAEQGAVEYRCMARSDWATPWIEGFIALESRGWKGDARTALADDNIACEFVRTMLLDSAERGRLQAIGIWLNGQPVAMKLNLVSTPGSFAFKIAYDESLAKFSPGVLLELENIRLFHDGTDAAWMDSCAAPDHPMINRLWRDRVLLQHVLLSTGTRKGDLAVGLRPLGRALRRIFGRGKTPVKQDASRKELKAESQPD